MTLTTTRGAVRRQLEVAVQEGATVAKVEEGGPADRAGVRAGDVIVEAGDRRVATVEDVLSVPRDIDPDDAVTLTVAHDGDRREISVTTTRRPD